MTKYVYCFFETVACQSLASIVWGYLPFFLYDATLFRRVNTRKSTEEIISFNLRSILSFRTMGVFLSCDTEFINQSMMRRRRQTANIPNPTHINRQGPHLMAAADIRHDICICIFVYRYLKPKVTLRYISVRFSECW